MNKKTGKPSKNPRPALKNLHNAVLALSKNKFGEKLKMKIGKEFSGLQKSFNRIIAKGQREMTALKKGIVTRDEKIKELETSRNQIRQSIKDLLEFQKLSEAISSSHDIQDVLDVLEELSRRVVSIQGSGVFLLDNQAKQLVPIRLSNLSESAKLIIQEQLDDGIIDWVIRERSPAVVPDIRKLPASDKPGSENNFIIIPLIVRDRGIGVYQIYTNTSKNSFTLQDLELLALLSNQTALAIENSQLYDQMNGTIRELAALYEVGKEISSVLNPDQLYKAIITSICGKIDAPAGWIFELRSSNALVLKSSYGNWQLDPNIGEDSPFHKALTRNNGIVLDQHRLKEFQRIFKHASVKRLACVPLSYHGAPNGVIGVASSEDNGAVDESKLGLLRAMSNQASVAIENSKLYHELLQANKNLTEMQGQLVQSGKLAALGQLAGGVAHEINNPLQIILGRVQMILMEMAESAQKDELKVIESETKRIASIVRGLLEFARQGEREAEFLHLDMNRALKETTSLLRHQIEAEDIAITENYEDDLPPIDGDIGMLKQVFINLCINAKQAMPEGGKLRIKSYAVEDSVVAEFADTGIGISANDIDKIYEPFFTTKEKVGGTGLGLSLSYGIIEKHNGTIRVRSQPGKGTSFIVSLPKAKS